MNARRCSFLAAMVAACLAMAGCDSKNPLSDPQKSKADPGLAGVWRLRGQGGVNYYHVGPFGDKAPAGVMRFVSVTHGKSGEVTSSGECVLFPTTLEGKTYLNVILSDAKEPAAKQTPDKAWDADAVNGYCLLQYKLEGDTLVLRIMDQAAKRRAIEAGKIKGRIEESKSNTTIQFTDTTENLARFVAGAGDSLFAKEPLRLDRVK